MSLLRHAMRALFYVGKATASARRDGASVLHDDETRLREFEHAVLAVVAAEARAFPAGVKALIRIGGRAVHVQLAGFDPVGDLIAVR